MSERRNGERSGFSVAGFQTWMPRNPQATVVMSGLFAERLAELIFDCTDNGVDPDLIAFAHQLQNLKKNAAEFHDKPRFIRGNIQEANHGNDQSHSEASTNVGGEGGSPILSNS